MYDHFGEIERVRKEVVMAYFNEGGRAEEYTKFELTTP
jgi:hypothetical protein